MSRKRDKPVERLRSSWTSTADLEETLASMFNVPTRSEDKLTPGHLEHTEVKLTPELIWKAPDLTAHPNVAYDAVSAKLTTGQIDPAEDKLTLGQLGQTAVDPEAKLSPGQCSECLPVASGDKLTRGQVEPGDQDGPGDKLTRADALPTGPLYQTLDGTVVTGDCIHPYDTVQHAHTASEHLVYTTMWKLLGSRDDEGSSREGKLSLSQLTARISISRRNLRRVLQSLIQKLAIEVTEFEDRAHAIPRSYRVWGFRATIDRRRQNGYTHIYRNRNYITLARSYGDKPEDNLPSGRAVLPEDSLAVGAADSLSSGPEANLSTRPEDSLAPLNNKKNKPPGPSSTSSPVVAAAILRHFGFVDDDAIALLIRKCRENAPDASDEEIAELAAMQARRIRRMRNVENPVGLLISQVARCFKGEPFAIYRREKAQQALRLQALYDQVDAEEPGTRGREE